MKKKYILVGAKPQHEAEQNPGGQLTASRGLVLFASKNNIDLDIIDISQKSFPVPSIVARIPQAGKRILLLIKKLQQNDVDGVIIFSNNLLSFSERICMSAICRLFRVKDLFFNRGSYIMEQIDRSWLIKKIVAFLLKLPYRLGTQGIVWISYFDTLGIDMKKIVLIPNWLPAGVEIAEQSRCIIDNNKVRFIFVAWLNREKGVGEILVAIKELRMSYSFEFTFVGSGKMEQTVREEIENEGWYPEVKVTGWQEHEKVMEYLSVSDVFVLPSYTEGFPNALLEAMAKGLPAICSNVGCIPDSVINNYNGFLIQPHNVVDLKNAMKQYITNPGLISIHSGATLEIARKRHDFTKNCQEIFSVFGHQF